MVLNYSQITRRAMLYPTYNDPPDVSRWCGNFLIGQVHIPRRPPHTPHITRSDMPQLLTARFAFYRTTRLCVQKKLNRSVRSPSASYPKLRMRHAQSPAQSPATPTDAWTRSPKRQSALELSHCPSPRQQHSFAHQQAHGWDHGVILVEVLH